MKYLKNARVFFPLALLTLTLTGMVRAEVASQNTKDSDTPAADIQTFLRHEPTTEQGKKFKEAVEKKLGKLTKAQELRVASVGRLLKIALNETPKLATPEEEAYVRKLAPQVVELWAGKYSQHGPKAEKFMVKILNGFKDDKTGQSIAVYLKGAEQFLLKDSVDPKIDDCFKGCEDCEK